MRTYVTISVTVVIVAGALCGCERESLDSTLSKKGVSLEQVQMMVLRNKLADTAWTWPNASWPESKAWFQLRSDGTVIAGWNSDPCLWATTSGSTIQMLITGSFVQLLELKINADVAEAEMRVVFFEGEPVSWKQITVKRVDEGKIEKYLAEGNRKSEQKKKLWGSYR